MPNEHREVINGRMTVTRVRRQKGEEYKVWKDVGIFEEKWVEVTKRKKGYDYVSTLIYAGPEKTGEPVADWELLISFRYDLPLAAQIAVQGYEAELRAEAARQKRDQE